MEVVENLWDALHDDFATVYSIMAYVSKRILIIFVIWKYVHREENGYFNNLFGF